MTRDTVQLNPKTSDRRLITFQPSAENMAFLEKRKKIGIPYSITINASILAAHKKSKAR